MKSYHAPTLTIVGSTIELTQGLSEGHADGGNQLVFPAGSIGFNL